MLTRKTAIATRAGLALLALLAPACAPGPGLAGVPGRVELDITREALPRLPIALNLPEDRPEFNRVLEQDLYWSGFFQPRRVGPGERVGQGILLTVRTVDSRSGEVRADLVSVVPEDVFFRRGFTVNPPDERYLAHVVAAAVIEEITGEKAITLTRIVTARRVDRERELVLLDYDGARPRPLTRDRSINRHPRFSPDGKEVLYTSFVNYWPVVYRQEIQSGRREIVASYPGLNTAAVFHPSGRKIALSLSVEHNPGDIFFRDLETGQLTPVVRSSASDTSPVFLPGGDEFVFVSDRTGRPQVYHLETDGGRTRRLTFESHYSTSPAISPDGRFLAYTAIVDGRFAIRLLVLDTGQDIVLASGPGNKEDPAFAPNSRHLVFVHTSGGVSNLRLIDIFRREVYTITRDGGYSNPDWH